MLRRTRTAEKSPAAEGKSAGFIPMAASALPCTLGPGFGLRPCDREIAAFPGPAAYFPTILAFAFESGDRFCV